MRLGKWSTRLHLGFSDCPPKTQFFEKNIIVPEICFCDTGPRPLVVSRFSNPPILILNLFVLQPLIAMVSLQLL